MIAISRSFAMTEYRALLRSPISMVFFFGLPAIMSAILGPSVTGLSDEAASGRATVGFAVMFAFMSVNYVGRAMFREYHNHTWRRTAIVDPPRWSYLLGKCFAVFTISLGQLCVFAVVAVALLDLRINTPSKILQMLVIFVLHAATGVAVGAAMFTLVRRAEAFFSLTYLVLIAFGALGGAIVATDELPGWSGAMGVATPHFWSMRALDELNSPAAGGSTWSTTLVSGAALLGIAVVLFGFAAWKLDYRILKHADD